jgi:CheY-like chemotaxis protein
MAMDRRSTSPSPFENQDIARMPHPQIVLIEDNPADKYLVELALQENHVPYEMTWFNNGEGAIKVLCPRNSNNPPTFVPDAILLDLNTPKSDGFEVLALLRSCLPHIPVAVITSSHATSDRDRVASFKGVRYILKPSQLHEFLSTVGGAIIEMLDESTRQSEPSATASAFDHLERLS